MVWRERRRRGDRLAGRGRPGQRGATWSGAAMAEASEATSGAGQSSGAVAGQRRLGGFGGAASSSYGD